MSGRERADSPGSVRVGMWSGRTPEAQRNTARETVFWRRQDQSENGRMNSRSRFQESCRKSGERWTGHIDQSGLVWPDFLSNSFGILGLGRFQVICSLIGG